jgi:20S proteasome subunit alpha 7
MAVRCTRHTNTLLTHTRRIHSCHDEVKDKEFELELSWIGPDSNFRYELVPRDIKAEAQQYARARIAEDEE